MAARASTVVYGALEVLLRCGWEVEIVKIRTFSRPYEVTINKRGTHTHHQGATLVEALNRAVDAITVKLPDDE